jgi:hypothetical protein
MTCPEKSEMMAMEHTTNTAQSQFVCQRDFSDSATTFFSVSVSNTKPLRA